MEFKSQYRRLLLLIVPFIILLAIHIVVPLCFFLFSQPQLIQYYTDGNANNMVKSLRSYSITESRQITQHIGKYVSTLQMLTSYLSATFYAMNINTRNIQLNNAFEFYESTLDTISTNRSMWFASNATSISELNTGQQQFYKKYLRIEPFIQTSLDLSDPTIQGFFVSTNTENEELYFHYPSYKEPAFSSLSNSIIQTPFEQFQILAETSNDTIILNSRYGSNFQYDTMAICQALLNSSQIYGVACVQLNFNLFLEGLAQAIYVLDAVGVSSCGHLVSPIQGKSTPTLDVSVMLMDNNLAIFYYNGSEAYSSLDADSVPMWADSQCSMGGQVHQFGSYRINQTLVQIVPICTSTQDGYSVPLMFYVFEVGLIDLQSDITFENSQQTLKTILIPTLVSMLVFIVLSVCIQKYLMKTIDYECYHLNESCKFIVDGDIDIKIPTYTGSKQIQQVYEQVRIINKIFKYSSKDYFVGHCSEKILKYDQALKLFDEVGYDSSFLYENIGDSYWKMQEYENAIFYMKKSVDIIEKKMLEELELSNFAELRNYKQIKYSNSYKEKQIIIIRRMWKLIMIYIRLLEINIGINQMKLGRNKRDLFMEDFGKYTCKFRQVLHTDLGSYSEGVLCFLFEAKLRLINDDYRTAKALLEKGIKYCQIYTRQYDANTVRMKQKGSKNRFFHKRNKISGYSRCHPQIISSFSKYIEARLRLSAHHKKKDYSGSFYLLSQALKISNINLKLNHSILEELLSIILELSLNPQALQTTQIFRQAMPFKTLHDGYKTPDFEEELYRMPTNKNQSEMREYIFLYDVGNLQHSDSDQNVFVNYIRQRSDFIFDKYVKKVDRVSIAKFSSHVELETLCKLTIKQFNESLLRQCYRNILDEAHYKGKNFLIPSIAKMLLRVRRLRCEKVIIVFLRPIVSYLSQSKRIKKRMHTMLNSMSYISSNQEIPEESPTKIGRVVLPEIGENIAELMSDSQLKNCKLLLMCSKFDDDGELINCFGLKDINQRIWNRSGGINKQNNVVYVISDKHKVDVQRILVSKVANADDNHVFVF